MQGIQQLGDARRGKLAGHLAGFGRALRRAGVRIDPSRIALGLEAAMLVGVDRRDDLQAALEAVMVGREQDRLVFRELFDAWFQDPALAQKMLARMLPNAEGRAEPVQRRNRVREALAAPTALKPAPQDEDLQLDAAMSAGTRERLQQADFNSLGAAEYRLVERLAREKALPVPTYASRRLRPVAQAGASARIHWPGVWRQAARHGGEIPRLPRQVRRARPRPLLVLVDVSGSMERYARLLLAYLHAATRPLVGEGARRDVFAFGTGLTDLTPAFRHADTDAMLAEAGHAIADFAGGTRLGEALAQLRRQHARRLVGRRTLVLLISDGLDTGEPAELDAQLHWLRRHTGALLWLNPLLRFAGYAPLARGAALLDRHADAMLAVHNLQALDELADSLAALMRRLR
ncbi:vWA domain-containing protein [Pseudacidovorax intermedius]|uniref:von Willebrand factor A n=1 Tax=Pseudacidovorax intermedius TaxID=433924 RepID=A0A147GPY3_9BURK|nr:VWA domain-containing protein [Pseudacidovorax intermedius]KTT17169.1 von Willebrand factor A [Pseudacidovorax intermedius]